MSKSHRVLNITRNFRMNFEWATEAVEACACEWVEQGISVRDLTRQESIAARNERARLARLREPMPPAELPDCVFEGPRSPEASKLIRAANQFFVESLP